MQTFRAIAAGILLTGVVVGLLWLGADAYTRPRSNDPLPPGPPTPHLFRIHQSDVIKQAPDGTVLSVRCTSCGGSAVVEQFERTPSGPRSLGLIACPHCGGSGVQTTRKLNEMFARNLYVVPDNEPSDYPSGPPLQTEGAERQPLRP